MQLLRHPDRPRSALRAWDAADDYLLEHLVEQHQSATSVLVVNDSFGALAIGLGARCAATLVDSENGRIGLRVNAQRNDVIAPPVRSSLEPLGAVVPDLVLVKVPRSLGQLEDQLHRLRDIVPPGVAVVGAGMTKRIHHSTIELFERIIGPSSTSLARRKARLILSTKDPMLHPGPNPWPLHWSFAGVRATSHGGVFSPERVDRGTELLLRNIPEIEPGSTVVDLGCGNGIVGAVVGVRYLDAQLTFVDESYRATASTRETWRETHGTRPARVVEADRLVNVVERGSVDLVLCNPPFHDDKAMGDAIAWDMFVDAHAVVRPGGELRIVGNRHLGYHAKLGKIFGSCEAVASTKTFVVLSARR